MRLIALILTLVTALATAPSAYAQNMGQLISPILTIDREALFERSQLGQRVSSDLEAESNALSEETRQIEAELEAEEQALTAQRSTMTPEDFRAAADAFDARVVQLRNDRDATQSEFVQRFETAQRDFYNQIGPVLGQIMQARGAVVLLDNRSVLLAANAIDVTDDAVALIDATFGDGDEPQPEGSEGAVDPAPDAPVEGGDEAEVPSDAPTDGGEGSVEPSPEAPADAATPEAPRPQPRP
ncbi:MAG: OmpH family outer membrane protein [Pseudomonadota bacterium]|nr:OmpH family outer membrane protein [Pseudomonadota bacterium]